jgi:hypothetical protein
LRGTNSIPSWQAQARQRKALSSAKSSKDLTARPSWDSRPVNSEETDNQNKMTHAELLQRKLNAKSKNQEVAK